MALHVGLEVPRGSRRPAEPCRDEASIAPLLQVARRDLQEPVHHPEGAHVVAPLHVDALQVVEQAREDVARVDGVEERGVEAATVENRLEAGGALVAPEQFPAVEGVDEDVAWEARLHRAPHQEVAGEGHAPELEPEPDEEPELRALPEAEAEPLPVALPVWVLDGLPEADSVARADPEEVAVVEAPAEETAGVNDRAELAERAEVIRARINLRHLRAGVTLTHPASTFIDAGVEIGPETTIGPNVSIHGECEIGAHVIIDQGAVLTHTTVGDGAHVKPYSVLEEAVVGPRCHVGPFARLRPGTVLEEDVHVGNFVETKKARLRKGTKAGHLAYLGDADIGPGCNIGAGTITCNYDGVNKHETVLGSGVFVGSDTQLVAPVRVGDGAFIGAGSTITEDVPAGALSMSRTPQTIKEGWAERRRKVLAGLKQG